MLNKIRILQLGDCDWGKTYSLPADIEIVYEADQEKENKLFDLVFLDRIVSAQELQWLKMVTKAYCLYVTEELRDVSPQMEEFFCCKKVKYIARKDIYAFLMTQARNYFSKPYGEKMKPMHMSVAQDFHGSITWQGNCSVCLDGEYGGELKQIVFWRNNIPIYQGQAIEMWLEYEKDDSVEIALEVTQFVQGSVARVQQKWQFDEDALRDVVVVDNTMQSGPVFVSILAKGSGCLKIIALHDRHSRRGHGVFLPGGERFVTSGREEIFAYFDPGDRKPPLNIYFSGYKTMQGFEGYHMMRKLGCPFLLIAEPRLEGGSFYMGTEEYEKLLADIIRKYMKELGFSNHQVIMSGLSMGTYGALYYGCDIRPHAMLLGKPLASIGDIAKNERIHRPGGFPTSLDVLQFLCGKVDFDAILELNRRFWDKFDRTDWSSSKFIMSYMIEDDYDSNAYEDLISHIHTEGVQVYGKGIHGRHNDDTRTVVNWFVSQYHKILREDFSRRIEQ